ncbi:MAG: lysylphosphatidylglycerol synthase transmembrane domain-containing protein [Vicinamibacterales bacterium]|nr:lysylphosphatidylglycerol synthase transmembrane domain-containing protein [Vicinamibacterales bacterium]
MSGRTLRLAGAVAVSGIALWVAFRAVPLDALAAALRSANYWWLAPYVPLAVALNVLRGEIWRRLLSRRVTTPEAFWAYSIGFLVNNVMPFRMGEAARVVALASRRRLPVVEVAAAAGLERLCDVIALLIIMIAVLPFVAHVGNVAQAAWLSAGLVALALAGLAALVAGRRHADRLMATVAGAVLPRHAGVVVARWHELMEALGVISRPGVAVPVAAGAATVWILTLVLQWTVLKAFQPAASMAEAAVFVAVVSVGGAIPAAPGAIGTYQWVGQQALTIPFPLLYSPPVALAVAVVSHAASYVFSSLLGAAGLWYFGMPLAQLRQDAAAVPALEPEHL